METTPVDSTLIDTSTSLAITILTDSIANSIVLIEPVSKEVTRAPSEHIFLTPQMVIVTSAEIITSSNINVPISIPMTNVVNSTPLNVNPISVSLPTKLSVIGDNLVVLTQVLELLKSHGHVLHSLSGVGSSSQQQALFTKSPSRPTVSINVEYFGLLSNEGHSCSGNEDDLIFVKTLKGNRLIRVRESARIKE
ncbi:hypothetical protein M9H77_24089 [Catharanthus roseus]|uniref:Uncharacterized protein n=1 Tax=Catharanthus roseus TaxID=4058 RepID=A0ACC0AVJ6_CATRO|nr:hypothetical protein M9H77_24089 [Catharanthus roseus]